MKSIVRSLMVVGLLTGLTGPLGCSGKPDAAGKMGAEKQAPGQPGTAGKQAETPVDVPKGPARPTESLDLAYVAPQFFAAVVLHPQRLSSSSTLAELPQDDLLKEVTENLKLDPRKIEEAVILLAPEAIMAGPDSYVPGAIVRFTEDVDGKKLLEGLWGVVGEATVAGKPCYTTEGPRGKTVAVHFPNARTAVIADETTLGEMLAAGEATSPLLARLAQVDAQGDLILVASLEPLADMVAEMAESMEGNPELPAAAAAMISAAKDLKAAAVTLDLTGPVMVRIELDGNGAAGTARIESAVSQGIESGRDSFGQMRAMIASQLPPEVGKPLLKLADEFLAGISVKKAVGQVVVTAQRPATLDDTVKSLTPMAMTAVGEARQAAKRAERMNRLKQIALAMHIWASADKGFPPAAIRDKQGKPLLSWRVAILPYIERDSLYKEFHLDEPWDSEHNKKLLTRMPKVYKSRGVDAPDKTSMMVFTGEGTPFGGQEGPKFQDITDGSSNTILLVEAGPDKAVPWTKPEDLALDGANPIAALGDLPDDGFLAAFFDGSVHLIRKMIEPETLRRLIQHADGQPIEGDF